MTCICCDHFALEVTSGKFFFSHNLGVIQWTWMTLSRNTDELMKTKAKNVESNLNQLL